jgi:hypothetical protein
MRKLLMAITALTLTGCGDMRLGGDFPTETHEYTMEGTKLIATGIDDGRNETTMQQPEYQLSQERRLLLRFNDLDSHVSKIKVGGENKVELQVTLAGDVDPVAGKEILEACPITRQWSMLATWNAVSPTGGWSRAGGDHDSAGCFKPYKAEDKTLYFDASRWFIDYPRGRKVNHGLMLKASSPITVVGDVSGSYSPRLKWNQ